MLPNADYLYACDDKWWRIHIEDIRKTFTGKLYTQWHRNTDQAFADEFGLTAIEGRHHKGLGRDVLHFNSHSGAQAINLAYLLGAGRIILLGYDMGVTGQTHWFGKHPKELTNGNYANYVASHTQLASDLKSEGVEVLNCSRRTGLSQYPRVDLDDVA